MIKNKGDKMKDKTMIIFMIANIIVIFVIIAILSGNKKVEKPKNDPTFVDIKSKTCSLTIEADNGKVVNTSNLAIYYSNDIVTNYSINYELSYIGNKETETFKTYKADYENLINKYQPIENVFVKNYSYVDNVFTFTLDYTLIPNDNNELILNYNQNINDALAILMNQGYICG